MRHRSRQWALAIILAEAVCSEGSASAAVPQVLTEQGRLFETTGAPMSGTVPVTFAIYDVPTGGASLWAETQAVTLDAGYFSAQLGLSTPIPSTIWNGSTRYVGFTVGGDPEASPRQLTTTVPYAVVAGDVAGNIHPTSVSVGGSTGDQREWELGGPSDRPPRAGGRGRGDRPPRSCWAGGASGCRWRSWGDRRHRTDGGYRQHGRCRTNRSHRTDRGYR